MVALIREYQKDNEGKMYIQFKGFFWNYFKANKAKRSYSQSGEDIIVMNIFSQLKNYRKTFIDVGAHHPIFLNNTNLLYKNGWHGINIEPNPNMYKYFLKYRKKDINLNIGILDKQSEIIFYEMSPPTMSTFSKHEAEKLYGENGYLIVSTKNVQVDTIENVVNRYCQGECPAFMSLDVEGFENKILESINFKEMSPIVICAETISFSTKGHGVKEYELIKLITDKGYFVYADTYINTIFVNSEHWGKNHV